MASKNRHGLDIYDLLIGLVLSLSVTQAERLYTELLPRYSKRAKTKLYNVEGVESPDGKVRLTEYQYKAIRTKYGETFMRQAFKEMTRYINYLEEHQDTCSKYKSKLRDLNSKTHNAIIGEKDGWVYEKCKAFICTDRPPVAMNPYLIDDFPTAREYIRNIPEALRQSMDVQALINKFPELKDVPYGQN